MRELIKRFDEWNKNPKIPISQYDKELDTDIMNEIFPNGFPVHPLTCGNDSNHNNLVGYEENNVMKLKCPDCDYRQDYVPLYVMDFLKNNNESK